MDATATAPVTRRLPLVALLAVNAVSTVGSMLTVVALPWFVLETTGSAARAGISGFFVLLPSFLAGIFGGAVVDRLGGKRASVVADLVSGAGIALVPLLYHTVGLAFWHLLALVFVGGLLEIPGITARRSMLPELAGLAGTRLERVNAAYEGNQQVALLIGAPLAGLLVAWLGASNVLWLDAATFAFSALVIGAAVPSLDVRSTKPSGSYFEQVAAGLRFLRGDRLLLALAVGLCASNIFGTPLFAIVLPVYAKDTLGSASDLGLVLGAVGAGQVVGTITYGAVGHRLPRRALWLASFLVWPLPFWALATGPSVPILVALLAAVAFVGAPINPLAVTVRHERIPADLRGRVFATFSAVALVAAPLGVVAAGFLIERVGFAATALGLAAGSQLVGVGMLFVPALRELDRAGRRTGGVEPAESPAG